MGSYDHAPHLWKYATLYRGIARASGGAIGPDVVDSWESWQCAAYLGIGLPVPDEAQPGAPGRDVMAERVEWLEARQRGEERPPPEPDMPIASDAALLATFDTH